MGQNNEFMGQEPDTGGAPLFEESDEQITTVLDGVQPHAPDDLSTRSWLYNKVSEHPKLTALIVGAGMGGPSIGALVGGAEVSNAVAATATPNVQLVANIGRAQVSGSDIVSKKLFIGQDEHIKGTEVHSNRCFNTKGGFTNSEKLANGQLKYYWDPVSARLCPNPNSPTGWAKVAGGTTNRDCNNAAKTGTMPNEVPISEILNVSTLNTSFKLTAKIGGEALAACGSASANLSVSQRFSLKEYLRAKGSVERQYNLSLADKVEEKFKLEVQCTPLTPTTVTETTPSTTTTTTTTTTTPNFAPPTISMITGQEQVPVNSRVYLCAQVGPAANPGDTLSVTGTTLVPGNPSASAGTLETQPTYDARLGDYCAYWDAPGTATTDAEVVFTVTDTTEQAAGATTLQDSASDHTDIAVQ